MCGDNREEEAARERYRAAVDRSNADEIHRVRQQLAALEITLDEKVSRLRAEMATFRPQFEQRENASETLNLDEGEGPKSLYNWSTPEERDAARKLASFVNFQLGTRIHPADLLRFLKSNWPRVSTLAHKIHGKPADD